MTLQASYQVTQEAMQSLNQDTFSRYTLDNATLMDSLRHILKGEELVEEMKTIDGQEVPIQLWKPSPSRAPMINDKGYFYTISLMTLLTDKVLALSTVDEEQAGYLVREVINQITVRYYEALHNNNEFKFNSQNEMDSLIATLLLILLTHLRRSIDMNTLDKLLSQHSVSENRIIEKTNAGQPQQKGLPAALGL